MTASRCAEVALLLAAVVACTPTHLEVPQGHPASPGATSVERILPPTLAEGFDPYSTHAPAPAGGGHEHHHPAAPARTPGGRVHDHPGASAPAEGGEKRPPPAPQGDGGAP